MADQFGGHGRCAVTIFARAANIDPQRLMRPTKMIISQTPLNMEPEMVLVMSNRLGAAREESDEFAQGEIGTLDVGSLNDAG